jgi:Rps23 Pro-64 3,4-dihydroxylase Tpa1-like proline 4-hydroxylase
MKKTQQQQQEQQQLAAKRPRTSETVSTVSTTSASALASMNETHLRSVTDYKTTFKNGQPFPHLFISKLLTEGVLEQVRDELLLPSTNWNQKKNDLYDFYQSDSLTSSSSLPATRRLVNLLYSQQFRGWIETITGISTTDMIDVSAAKYIRGSHLLCHDDNLSTRHIAYILYLTPEGWSEEDGGNLDLFCTNPGSDCLVTRLERLLRQCSIALPFLKFLSDPTTKWQRFSQT